MFFGIYMITVADPQILWNDGFYPLVDVTIPDGSYWKPKLPGRAVNARNHGIGRVFDLFGGLLGQTNPALLNAAGLLLLAALHVLRATTPPGDRKGEWFQLYSIGFGGIPGRPLGDGPDGHSLWPSFVNIPCEYLESYYPLRIEKWETVADTGGAGLHRGGNGVDVAYVLPGAGRRSRSTTTAGSPTRGASTAAQPGRARHASGSSAPTAPARCCPASATTCRSSPGDVLHFVTWGGGGWGDPLERDPELVGAGGAARAGHRRGRPRATAWCVRRATARSTPTATEALRDQLRADRPGRAAGLRHGPAARGAAGAAARRRPACRRPKRPVWARA